MRKCESADLPRVLSFYRHVAEATADMSVYGRWIYGLHPTDDMISGYVNGGDMYCLEDGGSITAAVALVFSQGEDYHSVNWQTALKDDEAATVHLLAVSPEYQHQGLARKLMLEVISLAGAAGMKAVRLDALTCNRPAHQLYRSLGFKQVDVRNWYASNTGHIDFYLFEYLL